MRRAGMTALALAAIALAGCSQPDSDAAPTEGAMPDMAMGDPASPYAESMNRMHAAMASSDDPVPGRNFAMKMTAHHQGAIEMAEIALREVQDPEMRALAQTIIEDQRREIAQMQGYLQRTAPQP